MNAGDATIFTEWVSYRRADKRSGNTAGRAYRFDTVSAWGNDDTKGYGH